MQMAQLLITLTTKSPGSVMINSFIHASTLCMKRSKATLKNVAKITRKDLSQSITYRCFLVDFAKFFKTMCTFLFIKIIQYRSPQTTLF